MEKMSFFEFEMIEKLEQIASTVKLLFNVDNFFKKSILLEKKMI